MAEWTITPKVEVNWFEETQQGYVDTLGNTIPEQTVSLGELNFGPAIGQSFALADGRSFSPRIGVTGIWTFEKQVGAGTPLSPREGDLRARLDASAAITDASGWQLFLGGYYDGLFLDEYQSVGGTATLKKSF